MCAVAGIAMYGAIEMALASEALTVTRITVQGNQRMSRGEVLALLEGLSNTSMVTADLESWRRKLLMSPWVADASIRRLFPGTLAVVVEERQPIGIGRVRGALYLIDRSGAVIDEYGPNYADFDLPIIDGLAARARDSEAVDATRAELAARLMNELQRWPGLAARISQIDVTDARNAVVILKGDTALVRVGEERFPERLQSYVDLLPALRERIPDIDYVDLRFDERVYVRPRASKGAVRRPGSKGRGAAGG